MRIRAETETDHDTVRKIVAAEFDTGTEADFVETVSRRGPVVSLVAEDSKDSEDSEDSKDAGDAADAARHLVGHVLLSPVPLDGDSSVKLAGLVSLAVVPERQGEGIGSALMRAGLDRCRELGFDGVVALGHPDFYTRFGFAPAASFGLRFRYRVPEDAFLALELKPHALEGKSGAVNHLAGLGLATPAAAAR
jgi:putative acetyltransferase